MSFIANLAKQLKRVTIDDDSSSEFDAIPAIADEQIFIIAMELTIDPSGEVEFRSGTTTSLTGVQTWAAKTLAPAMIKDLVMDWYICAKGESFRIYKDSSSRIAGNIYYLQA